MTKSDSMWPFGTDADLAWINDATFPGSTISSAVPSIFEATATIAIPDAEHDKSSADAALIEILEGCTPPQPWWLGYLETGVADVVFPHAERVTGYRHWPYVLVQAGPYEARTWRADGAITPWHSALPELLFPLDRSWLVSTLWDDDWRCVGGTTTLVDRLMASSRLDARIVTPHEDLAPSHDRGL